MATWSYLTKFKGYRESSAFPISLDSDGAVTTFSWNALTPNGTSVTFESNISLDGGYTWLGWKPVIQGGSVPDIYTDTNISNLYLKYRATLECNSQDVTPELQDVTITLTPVIEFKNDGDYVLTPELWIKKKGAGDFTIKNLSNANREFKFTGLIDNETVYVNSESEYIETDLPLLYRYDNFNDNYLELIRGSNILQITGNCTLNFRYQFKTLQG